jgi:hypothetical protein
VEQLYDKSWYAVTETLLAMSIFRDDFDVKFLLLFAVLLGAKCFHWLNASRVDYVSGYGEVLSVGVVTNIGVDGPESTCFSSLIPRSYCRIFHLVILGRCIYDLQLCPCGPGCFALGSP